ncbi:MAG TPA: carboxyltransferase domain-containing protein [Thermoanaerobaculia bacterium]|nr:carboxyltransferase domain-containing protein [Thermoanaerobaculia bacterium]
MHVAPAGDRALLIELRPDVTAAELHAAALAARSRQDVLACVVGHSSLYVLFRGAPDPSIDVRAAPVSWVPRRHRVEVAFEGFALDHPVLLTARYLGFRPGWAYLEGWPWPMPRRATSRPVKAGSFAVAGSMAGIYPTDAPGGWNVLGRVVGPLPEVGAGDEVEIIPTANVGPALSRPNIDAGPAESRPYISGMEIIAGGQLTTVVEAADYARLARGLSPGGPFDPRLAALAPLLECALVGPRVRFTRGGRVAWMGEEPQAFDVKAGEERTIGRIKGLRGWLAFGDPIDVRGEHHIIKVIAGPHATPIREIECEVTPQLDRVGIRLRPLEPLGLTPPADLPSIGMQFGTIQLHPDRSLVAMGPDHPITGGYLQPLTVRWDERWKLAQLAPGDRVRFVHSP